MTVRVQEIVDAVLALQRDILGALSEERWDDLQQHDQALRKRFEGIAFEGLSPEDAELLTQSMRGTLEFYRELNQVIEAQRDETARQLGKIRAHQKGDDAYREVEKRAR